MRVGQRRSANKCDKRKVPQKNLLGSHILSMSSFQQPLPPPPPPRPCASSDESSHTNPKDRIICRFATTEAPHSSCRGRQDTVIRDEMGHEMGATAHQKDQNEVEVTPQGFRPPLKPTLLVTVLASASFFVTIVLLLSIGKAIVFVNVLGFVFPASATVHGMVCPTDTTSTSSSGTKTKTKTTERRGRGGDADLSSAYAGYWVRKTIRPYKYLILIQ